MHMHFGLLPMHFGILSEDVYQVKVATVER